MKEISPIYNDIDKEKIKLIKGALK